MADIDFGEFGKELRLFNPGEAYIYQDRVWVVSYSKVADITQHIALDLVGQEAGSSFPYFQDPPAAGTTLVIPVDLTISGVAKDID